MTSWAKIKAVVTTPKKETKKIKNKPIRRDNKDLVERMSKYILVSK